MKRMFRMISLIIVLATALYITSCSYIFYMFEQNHEETLYREAIDDFFTALENKNKEGILRLFSKSAIEEDTDIQNSIDKLIEIYPDAPTQVLFNGLLHGGYTQTDGFYRAVVDSTFPVFCGGEYYWMYLELVYEDDFRADNIGVSCIEFYTADEYCIYYHSEEPYDPSESGFHLFAEQKLENDVICIQNRPYEYIYVERDITLTKVTSFLKNNTSLNDFITVFGQPNANNENNIYYYEVFVDGVAPVYVELGIMDNKIIYANLINNTVHLKSILEEK